MKQKSLVKNALFNLAYKILNVLFPLITTTYVSHVLMADGVGKVSYANNIVSYFVMVAALGIPSYGVREIAKVSQKREECSKVFSELFIINFCSTLICTIAYFVMINSASGFKRCYELYIIFGVYLFFQIFNVDWFYQGKEEYVYISVRSIIVKMISVACLFLFVKEKEDFDKYAIINCMGICGNYFWNIIHIRKYASLTFKGLNFKRHFRSILALVVCAFANELYAKVDITMLGVMTNDSVVGYVNNSHRIITMVLTITTAISLVFLPRLSYYYKNERENFNNLLNYAGRLIIFISVPCWLGTVLIAPRLVPLMFGSTFMPAIVTTQILSGLILVRGIGDIYCYQVIISSGNESKLVMPYCIGALLNIVLNYMTIPAFSQNGASVSTVISEFAINCMLFYYSSKYVKFELDKKFMLSVFASAATLAAGVFLVQLLPVNILLMILLEMAAGAFGFIVVAYVTKNAILMDIIDKVLSKLKRRTQEA